MKIRAIALNTFAGLVRNKLIILFGALFVCVVLLMMTPLMAVKAMSAMHGSQAQGMVLSILSLILSMVSGFGSLLAAWAAADAVSSEIRSGTILAVLARPVRRWEFLLGKYLGVELLMAVYVVLMLALSYLLAWIGGERIHSAPWLLVVYPLVRYALYSAVAMLMGTALHPIVAFGLVLVMTVLEGIVAPGSNARFLPHWLHTGLYFVLPSPNLLSEARFLSITEATLKQVTWVEHLTALSYGLDWALVFLLLAAWSFRRRSLSRDVS